MPQREQQGRMVDGQVERYRSGIVSSAVELTWLDVDPVTLSGLLTLSSVTGDALTFGLTSDSGALRLSVLSGSTIDKFYWSDAAEAQQALDGMVRSLSEYIEKAGTMHEKTTLRRMQKLAGFPVTP